MNSGCEISGSVAVHSGRSDPVGAQGRLDTGVALAKNLVTYCFGLRQNFPRRAFVLAVFLPMPWRLPQLVPRQRWACPFLGSIGMPSGVRWLELNRGRRSGRCAGLHSVAEPHSELWKPGAPLQLSPWRPRRTGHSGHAWLTKAARRHVLRSSPGRAPAAQ